MELISANTENELRKLVYHEDVSITNQGLKSRKFRPKTVTYWPRSDKPETCLITLFKNYNSLCPEDRPDEAFYLKPLPVTRRNQWYSKAPIGHNIFSHIVAQLCKKAGIGGHQTKHSLRAIAAQAPEICLMSLMETLFLHCTCCSSFAIELHSTKGFTLTIVQIFILSSVSDDQLRVEANL